MANRDQVLRFAVGTTTGPRSRTWRAAPSMRLLQIQSPLPFDGGLEPVFEAGIVGNTKFCLNAAQIETERFGSTRDARLGKLKERQRVRAVYGGPWQVPMALAVSPTAHGRPDGFSRPGRN